jgi:dTDP-L-rhamnose 4-epimerase
LYCTSVYALSKKDQEEYCLVVGGAYNIPTVALRYFNVYGTRQALSNPYTGVCAIFGARLLNNKPPLIFEDGRQSRDFIHVSDIVQANLLVGLDAEAGAVAGEVFNVGTGRALNLLEVADVLAEGLGVGHIRPEVPGRFRSGDIRHCVADIGKIQSRLGYGPRVRFEEGMAELVGWMRAQREQGRAEDRVEAAARELAQKGLAR